MTETFTRKIYLMNTWDFYLAHIPFPDTKKELFMTYTAATYKNTHIAHQNINLYLFLILHEMGDI